MPIVQMCDPHGSYNILTAPSDDMWRAVRKAVAVSFSASNVRKKFPLIRERCLAMCERLGRDGPGAVVDVDQAALKVTLDVIGLVSGAVQQANAAECCGVIYCKLLVATSVA